MRIFKHIILLLAITSGIYNPITIGERYDNYIKGLQEQSYNNYIETN